MTTPKYKFNFVAFLVATTLAGLVISFFVNIIYPDSLRSFGVVGQRWFSLSVASLYVLFTYLFTRLHNNWSQEDKLRVGLQSIVLTAFTLTYGLRLNGISFQYQGLDLNTNLIFVPLCLLVFAVNYRLFDTKKVGLPLLLPQVGLISLFIFSFLYFIDLDRTFLRSFGQDILGQLFRLPSIVWLILTASGLTLITALNLQIHTLRRNLVFGLIIFWLLFQTLLLIDTLNFLTYINKALLFVIFWDFIFDPIKRIAAARPDETQNQIWRRVAYHAILFVIVIVMEVGPIIF